MRRLAEALVHGQPLDQRPDGVARGAVGAHSHGLVHERGASNVDVGPGDLAVDELLEEHAGRDGTAVAATELVISAILLSRRRRYSAGMGSSQRALRHAPHDFRPRMMPRPVPIMPPTVGPRATMQAPVRVARSTIMSGFCSQA